MHWVYAQPAEPPQGMVNQTNGDSSQMTQRHTATLQAPHCQTELQLCAHTGQRYIPLDTREASKLLRTVCISVCVYVYAKYEVTRSLRAADWWQTE